MKELTKKELEKEIKELQLEVGKLTKASVINESLKTAIEKKVGGRVCKLAKKLSGMKGDIRHFVHDEFRLWIDENKEIDYGELWDKLFTEMEKVIIPLVYKKVCNEIVNPPKEE